MNGATLGLTVADIETATGMPMEDWRHQCHAVSLAIVRSRMLVDRGITGFARVARGTAPGVIGQHSWVVLGRDVYRPDALVLDCTLWSYRPEFPPVYVTRAGAGGYLPHGAGSIWTWGKPATATEEEIVLDTTGLSRAAQVFVDMLRPLDRRGWATLANAPMEEWPSDEVIGRMLDDPRLAALVPIDIAGMVTDRNPDGLYLAEED